MKQACFRLILISSIVLLFVGIFLEGNGLAYSMAGLGFLLLIPAYQSVDK